MLNIIYISKNVFFSRKLPRRRRLRVSQLWQKFSLEVNIRSESEKKRIFFFWKKKSINFSRGHLLLFCRPRKRFAAIVPKISKHIRKSSSLQDFHSELLLCKCSTGHVESIFDNTAKNFHAKTQVFLVKIQKRRKTNCSTVFLTLFLCTLRLLFQHPWLFFFAKIRKNSFKVIKEMIIVKITLIIFLKVLLRTREMQFIKLTKFFAKIWLLSLMEQKRSENYSSLQKSLKTFRCSRRLQFWEFRQKIHGKRSIFLLNYQKPWAKFIHAKETS